MKAVVFDIGGVMVHIYRTWQDAARIADVDITLPPEPISPVWNLPVFMAYERGEAGVNEYLSELSGVLGCSFEEARRVHNGILGEMYPGVPELIALLHEKGVRTGCLSNTNDPHWIELTGSERFASIGCLPMRMASYEVLVQKPDPEIFRIYAKKFGLEPSEIVFFDDHLPNVEAAVACGWHAHKIDPYGDPAAQMAALLSHEGVL